MLFNVINYSNEIIGQVEASDAVEAWSEAGKKYEDVLDVRPTEVKQVTTPMKYGSRVRERKFNTKEEPQKWVAEYMESLEPNFKDKRISRIWYSDPWQCWSAGIYIKEG